MASLRFMSFPSTTYLSSEHQSPLFSLLQKPQNPSHTPSNNLSLSCSHTLARRTRNTFVLKISATAQQQEQVAGSSSASIPKKVSTTRLILQNIPWEATAEDVRTLVEQYGTILDIELSMHNKTRNRGLAFVSFSTAEEARAALTNIKELNGRSVVVEYANYGERKQPVQTKPPPPLTFSLFVSNLPFEAESNDLKEFFEAEYDSVHSVELVFYENPRQPSGYGFVAFKTKKHADAALTEFEGKMFMGRPLRLQRKKEFVSERKNEWLSRPVIHPKSNAGEI